MNKSYKCLLMVLMSFVLAHEIYAQEKENQLEIGIPNYFNNLEPAHDNYVHTRLILSLIYQPLVDLDNQQHIIPVIAKSWFFNPDDNSLVMELNQHIRFSNGEELTSEDVAGSIVKLCKSRDKESAPLLSLKKCSKQSDPSIRILGKYRLSFSITYSPTTFLYELACSRFGITKFVKGKLIGTGPYVISSSSREEIELRKNPYYAHLEQVKNQGVRLRYLSGKELKALSQKSPNVNAGFMYLYEDVHSIKNHHYRDIKNNLYVSQVLVFNNQRYPFNHRIVRQALLAKFYNQKDLCQKNAEKAYGLIPPGIGGSLVNASPKAMSVIEPDEVFKQVPALKEKFAQVIIHQHRDRKKSCLEHAIQESAQAYNIKVKFHYHDSYKALEPLYFNHKVDAFIELFQFYMRDSNGVLRYFTKQGGANLANTKSIVFDDIFKQSWSRYSLYDKFLDYRRINQLLSDQAVMIPLYYDYVGSFMHDCIRGYVDRYYNPFLVIPHLYQDMSCQLE